MSPNLIAAALGVLVVLAVLVIGSMLADRRSTRCRRELAARWEQAELERCRQALQFGETFAFRPNPYRRREGF